MSRTMSRLNCALILLVAGLLCLGTAQVMAQTTEPPETEPPEVVDGDGAGTPNAANPPTYIEELMKVTELKQVQVDQMRADGLGWGEIRIATRLAEKIAANSGGTLTFDAALDQVLAERAAGKGFGEIAAENNLKVGELVKNEGKKGGDAGQNASAANGGKGGANAAGAKDKKPGFFARVGRFLGFGKPADKPAKPASLKDSQQSVRDAKGNKPERPGRLERSARPERLERPSKPEKPEKGPQK